METRIVDAGRRLPGEPGIWVFVLIDLCFFGLLFISYAYERAGQAEVFRDAQAVLNAHRGLLNTLILLSSSWFVALAVQAARNRGRFLAWLSLAAGCGAAFVAVKLSEFHDLIGAGASMLSNDFFMFYFVISSIHLLHVLAGIVVLAVMMRQANSGAIQAGCLKGLESAATYWHMVDLLWVMIFPLLYLVSWQ